MAKFHHDLSFNGTAEKAFELYKSVFGGEFTQIMRYNEIPRDSSLPQKLGR